MSPEQITAERAAFEKWWQQRWLDSEGVTRFNAQRTYFYDEVTKGWESWLARAEQAHAEQIALLQRLRDAYLKAHHWQDLGDYITAELAKLEGRP